MQNYHCVILNTSAVDAASVCWRPEICWEPLLSEQQLQPPILTALTHNRSPMLSCFSSDVPVFLPFAPPHPSVCNKSSYDSYEVSASSSLVISAVFLWKSNTQWASFTPGVALLILAHLACVLHKQPTFFILKDGEISSKFKLSVLSNLFHLSNSQRNMLGNEVIGFIQEQTLTYLHVCSSYCSRH